MRISFVPLAVLPGAGTTLVVSKAGYVLTINGDVVDLSGIPDGASLPAEAVDNEFVVGTVERVAGTLHVTLLLPFDGFPWPPVAFPADIVSAPDGIVAIPKNEGPAHGHG